VLPPEGHPKNPPAPPCAGILGGELPPYGRLILPQGFLRCPCCPPRGIPKIPLPPPAQESWGESCLPTGG